MPTFYDTILQESEAQTFKRVEDSRMWFRDRAQKVSKSRLPPTKVIEDRDKKITTLNSTKFIGSLFLYNYSPKLKKTLPYYDTFPIVFPFKILSDGFLGLNLHYLPYPYRAVLMDGLYQFANSTDMDKDTTRLAKISYSILKSKSSLKPYLPCIKRYLNPHIKSKMALIPPSEWELALFLPLQRFQKQSDATVWKESVSKIKKGRRP
jgi:hypothetical protein